MHQNDVLEVGLSACIIRVYLFKGDTDYFDIVTGVLQGNTLALFLFIICLDSVLWMSIDLMKENG